MVLLYFPLFLLELLVLFHLPTEVVLLHYLIQAVAEVLAFAFVAFVETVAEIAANQVAVVRLVFAVVLLLAPS